MSLTLGMVLCRGPSLEFSSETHRILHINHGDGTIRCIPLPRFRSNGHVFGYPAKPKLFDYSKLLDGIECSQVTQGARGFTLVVVGRTCDRARLGHCRHDVGRGVL